MGWQIRFVEVDGRGDDFVCCAAQIAGCPREDAGVQVENSPPYPQRVVKVRLGYCVTPYQRLRLYNGAPFSRLLRHAGDTEDVFSA